METVGIIAAMSQESNALLRLIEQCQRSDLGHLRGYRFDLSGHKVWLLTSGMGMQRAAKATRALIEAASPQLLVSVGIAGAVQADLRIGDVVVSSHNCALDKEHLPGALQPLARLSDVAWQAAAQALQRVGAGLFAGTAVTTHGGQFTQPPAGQIENPVLEMETAGILSSAVEKSIPVLSLRSISDGPRAPIPFNLEQMLDTQDNLRTGAILRTILTHPKIIPQLVQMSRNSRLAADNAALALLAALSQPGPVIAD